MASYTKKAIRDAFIKLLNERPLIQSRFHRLCELKHGDLETMISQCEKK